MAVALTRRIERVFSKPTTARSLVLVPLFVGYALLTWYLAARYRRRLPGGIAVLGGLIGLVLLNWLHIKLGQWTDGEIFVPVLQTITYPYSVLVVVVGVFIFCIPREIPNRCVRCRYSLDGLTTIRGMLICPECGKKNPTRSAYRRSGIDRGSFITDDDRRNSKPIRKTGSAPGPAPPGPGAQNQQRHPADETPPQQAEQPG